MGGYAKKVTHSEKNQHSFLKRLDTNSISLYLATEKKKTGISFVTSEERPQLEDQAIFLTTSTRGHQILQATEIFKT